MNIWAVCKDPGGTNGILPVVQALRAMGHQVLLIANGKAVELLKDKDEHVVYEDATVIADHPFPDVMITSMCSCGGVGRDLISLLRGKCPTVALQDFWGARLNETESWQNPKYRPDYLIVNDEIGKKIALVSWPDYRPEQVAVRGYPALDKYADMNVSAITAKTFKALGLKPDVPLILFGGQGPGTAEALLELVNALNAVGKGKDFYLIPRPHPRTKDNFAEEMTPWQIAMSSLRTGTPIFDFFGQTDTPSLLASADLVISMFSTILVEAATLKKPNISILYENESTRKFRQETGLKEFPLVELGCSAKASTYSELCALLSRCWNSHLDMSAAQEKAFRVDGQNARRVAEFIVSLA